MNQRKRHRADTLHNGVQVMFVDYLEEAVWAYTKRDFSDEVDIGLRVFTVLLCVALNIKVTLL
jgi:hypothetical protein